IASRRQKASHTRRCRSQLLRAMSRPGSEFRPTHAAGMAGLPVLLEQPDSARGHLREQSAVRRRRRLPAPLSEAPERLSLAERPSARTDKTPMFAPAFGGDVARF